MTLWTVVTAIALPVALVADEPASRRAATPVEPIHAILDAFRTHDVVALGDGHGNLQAHAFLLSLIRDPSFPAVANDIVVEFGNARYQAVIDRYTEGDEVPYAELRRVWEDTTQPIHVFDVPTTEEVFTAVRSVNAARAPGQRLRVLLGDPPIDWSAIHSRDDARQWGMQRDSHPAELIQREVIQKHRKALVVYGVTHLMRGGPAGAPPRTIVGRLESSGTPVFVVTPNTLGGDLASLQADAAGWSVPSLALLSGTWLGAADFLFFLQGPTLPGLGGVPIETRVDAVLHLGPPASMSSARPSPRLCADTEYIEMRLARQAAIDFMLPPDNPHGTWEQWFKSSCSAR